MNDKIKQLNQYIMDLQMTEDNFNMLKEFVIDFNNEDNLKSFIFLDDNSTYYGGRNITQKKKVA